MWEIFYAKLIEKGLSVADVSRATGINQSTLSNWKSRKNIISAKNGALIAEFLGISMDELMGGKSLEKKSTSGKKYYFDDDTAEKAQELFENENMKILFDAARGSRPEDLQMAADLLERLRGTNLNG